MLIIIIYEYERNKPLFGGLSTAHEQCTQFSFISETFKTFFFLALALARQPNGTIDNINSPNKKKKTYTISMIGLFEERLFCQFLTVPIRTHHNTPFNRYIGFCVFLFNASPVAKEISFGGKKVIKSK